MRSSLMEMRIKEISELKLNGVYCIKYNKIFDAQTAQWLSNYLNQIHALTGCVFVVLGPDAELLKPTDTHIQTISDITEAVLKKHGVIDPRSKNGIIL